MPETSEQNWFSSSENSNNKENLQQLLESAELDEARSLEAVILKNFRPESFYGEARERQITRLVASKLHLTESFTAEELDYAVEVWTKLWRSLPKDKAEKQALLKQLQAHQKSEKYKEFSEEGAKASLLETMLCRDLGQPSNGNASTEAIVIALNNQCLSGSYLSEVLERDQKQFKSASQETPQRWETGIISKLRELFDTNGSNQSGSQKELQDFAALAQRLDRGELLLKSVDARKLVTRNNSYVARITLSVEDSQSAAAKELTLRDAFSLIPWDVYLRVVGELGRIDFNQRLSQDSTKVRLYHDRTTNEPKISEASTRWDSNYNKDIVTSLKLHWLKLDVLTKNQRRALEQQQQQLETALQEKAELPEKVQATFAQPKVAELLEWEIKSDDGDRLLTILADRYAVVINADASLGAENIATSRSARSSDEETFPRSKINLERQQTSLNLSNYSSDENKQYEVLELAGQTVIMVVDIVDANQDTFYTRKSKTRVSLFGPEAISGDRRDVQILSEYFIASRDAEESQARQLANLVIQKIIQANDLHEPDKKLLLKTILSHFKYRFGNSLIATSLFSILIPEESPQDTKGQPVFADEEPKKKKHALETKEEAQTVTDDWRRFIQSVTDEFLLFSREQEEDGIRTVDFETETEVRLIYIFMVYRDNPQALKKMLKSRVIESLVKMREQNTGSWSKLSTKIIKTMWGSSEKAGFIWKASALAEQQLFKRLNRKLGRNLEYQFRNDPERLLYSEEHISRLIGIAELFWDNLKHAENSVALQKKKKVQQAETRLSYRQPTIDSSQLSMKNDGDQKYDEQ